MATTLGRTHKVVNGETGASVAATGRGTCRGPQVVIKQMSCTLSGAPLASSDKRTTASGCLLRVGSVNVGTMVGRSWEVVEMVGRRNLDFCCVQETRWKGDGTRLIEAAGRRYKFYWKGGEERSMGVGVLVAERWIEKVIEVNRFDDRIMLVRVLVGKQVVNIVSVYAPQAGRLMAEKEDFWVALGKVVDGCRDKEGLIVCGDMNGHVGVDLDGFGGVHGGNGYGARNVEGEMLLEFAEAKELVVLNTMFRKEEGRKVTYSSGGIKSQIDYILVRRADRRLVQDVKVIPGEPCLTQHRLLIGVMRVKEGVPDRKVFVSKCRVWKLSEPGTKSVYQARVKERMLGSSEHSVNEAWIELREGLRGVADEVCGRTKVTRKRRETRFWGEAIDRLVKDKRKKFVTQHKTGQEVDKKAYRMAKRSVKRAVAKAMEVERCEFIAEITSQYKKGTIYKMVKNMVRTNRDVIDTEGIKNAAGVVISEEVAMRKIWKEYHENLLNEEFEWDRDGLGELPAVCGPAEQLSFEEVRRAIMKSRDGKASGPSGVVAEMLKACGELGVEWMTNICNAVVKEGRIPEDWKKSWMVNIYKGKGDALVCGSYRGIKLLEQPMKVLERVVERRIRNIVRIDEMQFGFTPGRGTTDAIFIVRQVQERLLEKKKGLWMAFVDLEKAFDRVPRAVLWWAMRVMKVDEWLVKVVQSMYEGATTAVRIAGGESEEFGVKVGVHQGSVLSPLLFTIVLEALSREFRMGLPWELLYADDLVLMAEAEEALLAKLAVWKQHMEAKGLRVNVAKTKVMKCAVQSGQVEKSGRWPCAICWKGVGANSIWCEGCKQWVHKICSGIRGALSGTVGFRCNVCKGKSVKRVGILDTLSVDGVGDFEWVKKFCYLGDMIGAGGGSGEASRARVRNAWCKFRELAPILTKRGASLVVKGELYSACVRSGMVYGSETWATGVEDINRLVRAERMMVRSMCGVSLKDGKSSAELLSRLGIVSVVEVVEKGRLRWYGHVERKDADDWVSKCREMEVVGSRGRGRPRKTWRQCVDGDRRKYGMQRVEPSDRDLWRECCRLRRPTRASMEKGTLN
jgi:hypothetical protein